LIGSLLGAGCARAPQRSVERLAILPFANLTGDAALDWIANAGPAILSQELAGGARVLPLRAASVGTAALENATQLLHCTFTVRSGSLRIQYALEDAARHRMIAAGSVDGTALFAVSALARTLDADGARPFSTPNPEAAAAWGRGEFERAVDLDPDFGTAWASLIVQTAQAGKPELAADLAARALARASLRTALDKAQIQLSDAALRKDEVARAAALTELVKLTPYDTGPLLGLAALQRQARKYPAAEQLYRRVVAIDPSNAEALNSLGYTEGESGKLDDAKQTFEAYGRIPNQAMNALDSLGEVYFMNGRFAEAEKYFSQESARDPNFLKGAPLLKAAYARWLGGDLTGADALVQKYLAFLAQQNDPLAFWREAVWLYATGRREQAMAALTKAPPDQAANMERQRAVWRGEVHVPEDLHQLQAAYHNTNPAADGLPRTLYAAALVKAGKVDEARPLLRLWPLPETASESLLQSLMYPRFLELRKTLGIQ
jgi:tetratricopeptide (TPR) repeat protein